MGLIGQGFTLVNVDLEDGFPEHLTIEHEVEWGGADDQVDWYVVKLDFSPTSNLRLTANSLDQLARFAEQLSHAVGERRRRDGLGAASTGGER